MNKEWSIRITNEAVEDIRSAAGYTRTRLHACSAANDFINAVLEEAERIAELPNIGSLVSDDELAKTGYHWRPVGNYILFYALDEANKIAFIERCLYGASDWDSIIK